MIAAARRMTRRLARFRPSGRLLADPALLELLGLHSGRLLCQLSRHRGRHNGPRRWPSLGLPILHGG